MPLATGLVMLWPMPEGASAVESMLGAGTHCDDVYRIAIALLDAADLAEQEEPSTGSENNPTIPA